MGRIFALLLATFVLSLLSCQPKDSIHIDYLGQKAPGMVATLFAPGLISTANFEHSSPAFSPDGRLVLWTVVDQAYRASLYQMSYEQGKWSAPYRPSFADTTSDDYYPSFSIDGKRLFFSSRRKAPRGYPATKDMRIWQVERNQDGWGQALPVDTTISKGEEYAQSVTQNGTLYFSSPRKGSTSWNLWKAEKTNRGFIQPVLLPYNINSVDYEEGPYIAPDESFLIFESQRPEGIAESLDLYICFRTKEGQWGMPQNMGPKINSASAERFARVSPDGKYFFFGSNRNMSATNVGFDIYWIDAKVIDELRQAQPAETKIKQALGDQILEALNENQVSKASEGLKKWLDFYSNSLDATLIYSSLLRRQKQYVQAEQLLAKAFQWKNHSRIVIEQALIKYGLNQDQEAVRLLAPVLSKGDQLRQQYIYVSNALLEMAKFESSEVYFQQAMAISYNRFEYQRRARRYALLGEKNRAFEHLNKALEEGLDSKQELENDPELEVLKSDARFEALLNKLK